MRMVTFLVGLEGVKGFPWTVCGLFSPASRDPPRELCKVLSKRRPPMPPAPHGLTILSRAAFLISCVEPIKRGRRWA